MWPKHHLIVAHEVINEGHDRTQLAAMGKKALEATGQEEIAALADRGYYNSEEVLALEGTGVLPWVPKTKTSNNPAAVSSAGWTSTRQTLGARRRPGQDAGKARPPARSHDHPAKPSSTPSVR